MQNNTDIIYVQDKDPVKVIIQFAEELAKTLIASEPSGTAVLAKCENKRERQIFVSAYHAALIDYLTARSLGHIEEPVFGNKKV